MRGWIIAVLLCLLACGGETPSEVIAIGDDAAWRFAERDQRLLTALWVGDAYVIFWTDGRTPAPMGQRFDASGRSLGDPPFAITDAPSAAAVGSNGVMLLAWTRPTEVQGVVDVVARRIGADGRELDAQPLLLLPGQPGDTFPDPFAVAVASKGDEFLVAVTRDRELRAFRVRSDGAVLAQTSRFAATACCDVAAAWDGSSYLITWQALAAVPEESNLAGIRIAPDLSWVDEAPFTIGTLYPDRLPGMQNMVTASNAGRHMIAWVDAAGDVQVSGLPGSGSPDLAPELSLGQARTPTVIAQDGGFIVTASLPTGVSTLVFLDASGQPQGEPGELPGSVRASAAGGPTPLFFEEGWSELAETEIDLVRIGDPGPVPLLDGRNMQRTPVIASTGELGLVAWLDARGQDATGHIRGARIAPGGELVDPVSLPISDGAGERRPEVASDGTGFLVAWLGDGLEAATVDTSGAVSAPIALGPAPASPSQWLLVGGPGGYTLFILDWVRDGISARRLGPDGSWLGDERLLDPPAADSPPGCNGLAAIGTDQGYLLACLSDPDPSASSAMGSTVSIRALSADLEPSPWQDTSMPWSLTLSSPMWNEPSTPPLALIPGDGQVLLALEDGSPTDLIQVALADSSGTWLEQARSVGAGFQGGFGVSGVWEGSRFLLVGGRRDSTEPDTWGMWLTDELVRDGAPFLIDSGQSASAAQVGPDILVTYESLDPAVSATRIRGQLTTRDR